MSKAPLKVMFVDDQMYAMEWAVERLRAAKFTVTMVDRPQNVIAYLEESVLGPWDAVITDFQMPLIKGNQLRAEIKKLFPNMPVFLWSGAPEDCSDKPCLAKGIYQIDQIILDLTRFWESKP
jgi:DNA-binding NtrC family response regulator